jgi:hypothetical protein
MRLGQRFASSLSAVFLLSLLPMIGIAQPARADQCPSEPVSWSISFTNGDGALVTVGPFSPDKFNFKAASAPLAPIDVITGPVSWLYRIAEGTMGTVTYNYGNSPSCSFSSPVPLKALPTVNYSQSYFANLSFAQCGCGPDTTYLKQTQTSPASVSPPLNPKSPVEWDPYLYTMLVSTDGCVSFPKAMTFKAGPIETYAIGPITQAWDTFSPINVNFHKNASSCDLDVYSLQNSFMNPNFPDPNVSSVPNAWDLSNALVYYGKWTISNPAFPHPSPSTTKNLEQSKVKATLKVIMWSCIKGKSTINSSGIKVVCPAGYKAVLKK